jgi:hypothetical protein
MAKKLTEARRLKRKARAEEKKIERERLARQKQQQRAEADKAKAENPLIAEEGIVTEVVYADDAESPEDRTQVSVRVRRNFVLVAYQRKHIQAQHRAAAALFERDYVTAAGLLLPAQKWGVRVDGGKIESVPVRRLSCADRVKAIESSLGPRMYSILVAVVIYGATPSSIHAKGGEQHVVVLNDIKQALNELVAFYSGHGRRILDRTHAAVASIIEEAQGRS